MKRYKNRNKDNSGSIKIVKYLQIEMVFLSIIYMSDYYPLFGFVF